MIHCHFSIYLWIFFLVCKCITLGNPHSPFSEIAGKGWCVMWYVFMCNMSLCLLCCWCLLLFRFSQFEVVAWFCCGCGSAAWKENLSILLFWSTLFPNVILSAFTLGFLFSPQEVSVSELSFPLRLTFIALKGMNL